MRYLYAATLFGLLGIASAANAQQTTWRVANGTSGNGVIAVDFYRGNPDTMFALCSRNFLGSTDRGEHWDSIGSPSADFGEIGIDRNISHVIYISIPGFTINSNNNFQSTDGGRTWRLLFIGASWVVKVIEFDPVEPGTVYIGVGPGRLYRSSDIGQTWDTLFVGGFLMSSLSIAPSNNNVLYAGFVGGVFKSTDRGQSWANLSFGFQPPGRILVTVDPRDANIVYAAIFSTGASPSGMYKTTDGGMVWNEINNGIGLDDRQSGVLAINPKNPEELLLGISSDQHILFRTTNGGFNWSEFVDGMAGPGSANTIRFDTLNNRMYVGAFLSQGGSGLYIRDNVTDVHLDRVIPHQVELSQNYPNPFNPSTTIQYSIPNGGHVSLVVYDVLGRQVAVLESGFKSAGSHSVNFDASSLASGVYMYRLQAGEFNVIKKMLVVK